MPPIVITAVITDGASVLLESSTAAGRTVLALPRYLFGEHEDSIEESLVAHLRRDLGIEVLEQEFLQTVYERCDEPGGVLVNNLQLVTGWEGVPVPAGSGRSLVRSPPSDLAGAGIEAEVLDVLLAAFGMVPAAPVDDTAAPGRVVLLTQVREEPAEVALAICAGIGRSALISLADLGRQVVNAGSAEEGSGLIARLSLLNAATLARNYSAAGLDSVMAVHGALSGRLQEILQILDAAPVYLVNLVGGPGSETATPDGQGKWRLEDFDVIDLTASGLVADVRGLTAADAGAAILEGLEAARIQ